MTEERVKRKLSAILSADVEGYSRLMGEDEVSTVKTLEAYRKVMADLIGQFRGRVVDSPGDNMLAEFSSVVDAVQCAVEIHEVIRAKNEELPEDRKMLFRIGVNLGDVIQEGERIYGDGVNIAARLEGLAEAGGVCISGSAYEQIKNKLALGYVYIGEHSVKNIAEPLKVYKVPVGVAIAPEEKKEKKSKIKKKSTDISTKESTAGSVLRHVISWIAVIILVTVIGGLIIGGMSIWKSERKEPLSKVPNQVMRFEYEPPESQEFSSSSATLPILAVSPDGSKFVYCTTRGLFLRSIDELGARFIAGTDGGSIRPFFSPDGKWLGFWSGSDQKLKKVPISGGLPVTLCNATSDGGFSWTSDNKILHGSGSRVMWVSANGGDWATLLEEKDGILGRAQMLPGGQAVIYLNASTSPNKIIVQSLKSGESRELLNGIFVQYVKTGHIVYGLENNLYVAPFDVETLEITGASVPFVEDVSNSTYFFDCTISDSGTMLYLQGIGECNFVWVDKEGKEEPLGTQPGNYSEAFKISPDGSMVALSCNENSNIDIWNWDIERKLPTRLTFHPDVDLYPIWTPDGKQIIFLSNREGGEGFYWKASDGSGKVERIDSASDLRLTGLYSISSDGKTLFFDTFAGDHLYNIGMLSVEAESTQELLLKENYNENGPQISPDGQWLAYSSSESGRFEIYVRPFPELNSGGRWQISTNGGDSSLWSPDGKELYYKTQDAIMAVSVETEPTFKPGTPRSLFQNKYWGNYDIHPDGGRFLMLRRGETSDPKIIIVVNWFEELKKRVPVD